jgi:hypothetical protein
MNKSMNLLAVFAATLILAGCHDEDVPIPDNTPTPFRSAAALATSGRPMASISLVPRAAAML